MTTNLTLQHIIDNRAAHLADLKRRQAIVRDYVRGVVHQYDTGLYLFGRPGTAKTHTVRMVLEEEIREIYVYQRGHLTPVGLFELIADHPDEVIVLDDLVTIFRSDIALQILLSALEHPSPSDRSRTRVVKYRRKGEEARTPFRDGIICISNRELHDDELLGAFKSRVHTLNYDPSDAQLGALMLDLAERNALPVPPAGRDAVTKPETVNVSMCQEQRNADSGRTTRAAAAMGLKRSIPVKKGRWIVASDPKRLKQVYQHIQRIKASDYAVIVGSHDEYRIVERPFQELPEPSKLAILQDAVDWSGVTNRDQAVVLLSEIDPGKITDAQRSRLIDTAAQNSYQEMLQEASARGGIQREKDIGIER